MKSSKARTTVSTLDGTAPARRPMNIFSISLCSVLVHHETNEIPFAKCRSPGYEDIAFKMCVNFFLANEFCAPFDEMILEDALMKLMRRSGVKHEKILEKGRFCQNGW